MYIATSMYTVSGSSLNDLLCSRTLTVTLKYKTIVTVSTMTYLALCEYPLEIKPCCSNLVKVKGHSR